MSERAQDRVLLGLVAIISLIILALIGWAITHQRIDEAANTLLGAIVGGLLVNSKDVIGAIRESWSTRQMEKMSDQLGSSLPSGESVQATIVNNPKEKTGD